MSRRRSTRRARYNYGVKSRAASTIRKTGNVKINAKKFIVSFVVLVFSIYFICTVIGQQVTLNRKNVEIKALNEQIEEAGRETERLREELESVNDPEYMERMARERLGLVTPNERVYIDLSSTGD